jgi:hypothetical protein
MKGFGARLFRKKTYFLSLNHSNQHDLIALSIVAKRYSSATITLPAILPLFVKQ